MINIQSYIERKSATTEQCKWHQRSTAARQNHVCGMKGGCGVLDGFSTT